MSYSKLNSSSSTKEYVAISFDISLHPLLLVLGAKRLLQINMQRTCHTLFYVCNAIIAVPGKNPNGWNNEHFVDLILGQHLSFIIKFVTPYRPYNPFFEPPPQKKRGSITTDYFHFFTSHWMNPMNRYSHTHTHKYVYQTY